MELRKGYYWVQWNTRDYTKGNLKGTVDISIALYEKSCEDSIYPWTVIGSDGIYTLNEFIPLKRIPDYK